MFSKLCVIVVLFLFSLKACEISGKVISTKAQAKLKSEVNIRPVTSYYRHNIFGPNTYAFGFEVNDRKTGNIQFRDERRYANGSIEGSYGYVRPDGSVEVTHFQADGEQGFLSQTQNFEPGDQIKWQEYWPTEKPTILVEKPMQQIQPNVSFDEQAKLNLTSILLPVESIDEEHGIDLNPIDLEKQLVNPVVLDVLNGETPLTAGSAKPLENVEVVNISKVNKFFPSDFPIVPFEIPHVTTENENKEENKHSNKENHTEKENHSKKYNQSKLNNSEKTIKHEDNKHQMQKELYEKSKTNNDEKSLPSETLKKSSMDHLSTMKPKEQQKQKSDTIEEFPKVENQSSTHKSKAISLGGSSSWYDKIIQNARKNYLDDLTD